MGAINSIKRSILRSTIRGGNRYRLMGDDYFVENFQHIIADAADCNFTYEKNSFFGSTLSEDSIRFFIAQHLMLRIGATIIPKFLLYANGQNNKSKKPKIIGPLPESLCLKIEKSGYDVNRTTSRFLWILFIFASWSYGVKCALSEMITGLKNYDEKYAKNIFLAGVSNYNLTDNGNQQKSNYSFLTWIKKNLPEKCIYLHNINGIDDTDHCQYVANPVPSFPYLKQKLKYIAWTIWLIFFSFYKILCGRWHYGFSLAEVVVAKKVDMIPIQFLPRSYYFTSSNMMKKPLWLDCFEAKGGETKLFLYSINIQGFEDKNGSRPQYAVFRHMTWKNIFVWSKTQKEYLARLMKFSPNFHIIGQVWFSDTDIQIQSSTIPRISYFDVSPKRKSWLEIQTAKRTYYSRDLCISSLNKICDLCSDIGIDLLYKSKRKFGPADDKAFVNTVSQISQLANIINCAPELSPQKLVEASDAVISLPFTSTAVIAQFMGKPTCYFDISGKLNPSDALANGIPIIQSIDELKEWIKENVNTTN